MPVSCAILKCNSRGYKSGRKFSSFPMLNKQTPKSLALTQARQKAWFIALNRANFFPSHFKNARVCDLHFVSGKSSKYSDVTNPDWVPTLRLGYEKEAVNEAVESLAEPSNGVSNKESIETDNGEFVFVDVPMSIADVNCTNSVGTQTEGSITGISNEIVLSYQEQIKFLEKMSRSKCR